MRLLVVAGEASGDLHAAGAVRELKKRQAQVELFGMGGDHLRAAGVSTSYDAHRVAVMGTTEVLRRLPTILSALWGLGRMAERERPDAALLVDLPDFNLRLARRLRELGIPVVYYVSPMVWAWRSSRVKRLARDVRKLCCIYPFEEAYLRERGVDAEYVGNPLLDEMTFDPSPGEPDTLALLPGSRHSEIERLFPRMLRAAEIFAAGRPLRVLVPIAATVSAARLRELAAGTRLSLEFLAGETQRALRLSQLALVKSGTSTLEALIAARPMVVAYRVSWVSWFLGKLLVHLPHVALPNLLAGRRLVPELLQNQATPEAMAEALRDVEQRRDELVREYDAVRRSLGGPGASARVAEHVLAAAAERKAIS
jgi:lipid-A-disaccharide synthase